MPIKWIGIQTIGRDCVLSNYGSFFQHYALRIILKKLGYTPFRREHESWNNEFRHLFSPIFILYAYLKSLNKKKIEIHWRKIFRSCIQRWKFVIDYKREIGKVFEKQNQDCYALIAGGDAVWFNNNQRSFLLDNCTEVKKLSYAASCPWDIMINDVLWCEQIKHVIETYHAIGVRESEGKRTITSIEPQARVETVLDPVMLLDEQQLKHIAAKGKKNKGRYILYYAVNIWNNDDFNFGVIQKCATHLGCELKIVGIQGAEDYIPKYTAVYPSPVDFISLVLDAQYVITNSFHGIVFAIQFKKDFAFIVQGGHRYGNQNCRQDELLSKFSLSDRKCEVHPKSEELINILSQNIDYEHLDNQIAFERKRCINWLTESLS